MTVFGSAAQISFVMAGFTPAIHFFLPVAEQDVDARYKAGMTVRAQAPKHLRRMTEP